MLVFLTRITYTFSPVNFHTKCRTSVFVGPHLRLIFCSTVILTLSIFCSQEKADKVISYFMKRVASSTDHNEVTYALHACCLIGFKHRPAIEKHRSAIETLKDSTSDNNHHNGCIGILDMLDGKRSVTMQCIQGNFAELE